MMRTAADRSSGMNGVRALCFDLDNTLWDVWPVIRRFGLAYGLFMLVNLIPALLTGGMFSSGRFTSTLFPMFLWLGVVVPPEGRTPWIATAAIVQGFVATTFFTWRALA